MVDDLLDVGHIMRGRVALRSAPLNLAEVCNTALESVRPLLEMRRQSVALFRDEQELFVQADAVRLCQVVANLLTNASKFSAELARIEIELEGTSGYAMLTVRDEGIGIDPQMLPRVFDGFLQGDRSVDRAQGGLGIGLTVVKHLIGMQGGQVEAMSAGLGQGSEFRITLPRIAAPPELIPRGRADAARTVARRRVLVVDDNRDAAESLRELLRMHGHEVEVVHDGAAALGKLDGFRADVVLLDIGLPRMDGFMVAHAIRARYEHVHSRPRLLALTGHTREEDRTSALRSGFDGHLGKPVEPESLLRLITDEGQRQTTPSAFD
jgi:CheY-like chemotaxis protein